MCYQCPNNPPDGGMSLGSYDGSLKDCRFAVNKKTHRTEGQVDTWVIRRFFFICRHQQQRLVVVVVLVVGAAAHFP